MKMQNFCKFFIRVFYSIQPTILVTFSYIDLVFLLPSGFAQRFFYSGLSPMLLVAGALPFTLCCWGANGGKGCAATAPTLTPDPRESLWGCPVDNPNPTERDHANGYSPAGCCCHECKRDPSQRDKALANCRGIGKQQPEAEE
jgi:hypothetical protein